MAARTELHEERMHCIGEEPPGLRGATCVGPGVAEVASRGDVNRVTLPNNVHVARHFELNLTSQKEPNAE
eukprot:1524788-Prymnesium_polylepis.2